MPKTQLLIAWPLLALTTAISALGQVPVGTDFTYQGQLILAGEAVNDSADFVFRLWDAEVDGNLIGSANTVNGVSIVDGLFTVNLDYGADAFNGGARWLEVEVRSPAGAGVFTTLVPRHPLTAAPYALATRGIHVDSEGSVGIGTDDPLGRLHVYHEFNPSIQFENNGDSTAERTVTLDFRHSNGVGAAIDAARDAGSVSGMSLGFSTQPVGGSLSKRMTINDVGQVGIGTDSPSATLEVRGDVTTSAGDAEVDQSQEVFSTTAVALDGLLWQSFTAGIDGLLSQIDLHLHSLTTASSGTLTVYQGAGIDGQVSASKSVTITPGVEQWASFSLSGAPAVVAGAECTIALSVPSGDLRLSAQNGDPYPAGHMDLEFYVPTYDLAFRTFVREGGIITAGGFAGNGAGVTNVPEPWSQSGVDLQFNGGNVGIGTSDPQSLLHVSSISNTEVILQNLGDSSVDRPVYADFRHANGTGARIQMDRQDGDEHGVELGLATQSEGGSLTRRLIVKPDGKVAIGLGSPATELEVNGMVKVHAIRFADDTIQETAFPGTFYHTVASGDFTSANGGATYKTQFFGGVGGSFIDEPNSMQSLIAPLNLPDGVTINSISFYGYDTISTTDVNIFVEYTTIDTGLATAFAWHRSNTSAGAYSATTFTNKVIDNSTFRYKVTVEPVNGTWHSAGLLAVNAVVFEYTYE